MFRNGRILGAVTMLIAGLLLIPSYAAFTPAVFLSLLCLACSGFAALQGAVRLAFATLVIVAVTVAISPVISLSSFAENPIAFTSVLFVPFALSIAGLIAGLRYLRKMRGIGPKA